MSPAIGPDDFICPEDRVMRSNLWRGLLIGGVLVALAGCASNDEWATWKQHPTHYASGDHGFFSLPDREGKSATVTPDGLALARDPGWWGRPDPGAPEQDPGAEGP